MQNKEYNIKKLRINSEPVDEYLSTAGEKEPAFTKRSVEYNLNPEIVKKLKKYSNDIIVFAFSAEWCPDCYRNIPILGLISKATDIEVRVFGHLMRDPKKPKGFWRIPPSAPEVEEFQVRLIPTIVILSKEGTIIGKIIVDPPENNTLEETILNIVEKQST
jgi:thiol-disulfide isomerase/thioredoxin